MKIKRSDSVECERAFLDVSAAKAVALFIFRRRAFEAMSVEHDRAYVLAKSPDLKAKHLAGSYTPDDVGLRQQAVTRTKALRHNLFAAATLVIATTVLAYTIGWVIRALMGQVPPLLTGTMQVFGAGILLWATVWELGWGERSFGGETLPERVHRWLFRALYTLGTALFVVTIGWSR